jgi:hypothetical protein
LSRANLARSSVCKVRDTDDDNVGVSDDDLAEVVDDDADEDNDDDDDDDDKDAGTVFVVDGAERL